MAKLDLGMAVEIFTEMHGRAPGATEMPVLREVTLSTPYLAGKEAFTQAWLHYAYPPTPPGEVKWDEFSLMGCLDR